MSFYLSQNQQQTFQHLIRTASKCRQWQANTLPNKNANKAVSKWLATYNALSSTEKENYKTVYANIMIEDAKALTQINQHYDALVCLKNAVKNGYSNAELLKTDSNLSALKTYSEFDKIVKSIK